MIDGSFALLIAAGLLFSIVGGWKVMRSTPIQGVNQEGYGATAGVGLIDELVVRQRQGWCLLVIGFVLQFCGTVVLAVRLFLSTT